MCPIFRNTFFRFPCSVGFLPRAFLLFKNASQLFEHIFVVCVIYLNLQTGNKTVTVKQKKYGHSTADMIAEEP